jgi:tetratricopeptide (TPR) repeat protein
LIQEFLSADPNSVPLLELNGELLEEKGDGGGAALQYAKAIELLLEHPEPGMESLHEELFEKVRSLSADDTLVTRLAARIKGAPAEAQANHSRGPSVSEAPSSYDSTLATSAAPPVSGAKMEASDGQGPQSASVTAPPVPSTKASPAAGVATEAAAPPPPPREPVRAPAVEKPVATKKSEVHKTETTGSPVPPPAKPAVVQAAKETPVSIESVAAPKVVTKDPAAPPPDYEAHYALGVAYKNMGLHEEAKEEFHVSMNSDSYYLDSALMTAVCLKEEHHFPQAILGLETVLADPRCQGAKGQAIQYELGLLYEAEQQWEKAAHAFESIPSFHDVPQRLAALKGKQGGMNVGFRYAS